MTNTRDYPRKAGTLRCPICFAPLVSVDDTATTVNGWVCSRYPFGYTVDAPEAITEAGCCPSNGYLKDRYRQGPVCMHAKEGTSGWTVYHNAPYLVPVQDTLVDLIESARGDGVSNGRQE